MEEKENVVDLRPVPELSGPVTIRLFYPIKFGSDVIEDLVFRRPKGKDMRDVPSKVAVGDMMKLAARLCGQPPSVMDELEMPDFNRVTEVVGNFLAAGQETGKTF